MPRIYKPTAIRFLAPCLVTFFGMASCDLATAEDIPQCAIPSQADVAGLRVFGSDLVYSILEAQTARLEAAPLSESDRTVLGQFKSAARPLRNLIGKLKTLPKNLLVGTLAS